jgi:hypothetical protein
VVRKKVGPLVGLVVLTVAWGFVLLAFVGGPVMSCGAGCTLSEAERAARESVYFEFILGSLPRVMALYAVGLVLIVMSVLLVRRALARRRSG